MKKDECGDDDTDGRKVEDTSTLSNSHQEPKQWGVHRGVSDRIKMDEKTKIRKIHKYFFYI